MMIMFCLVFKAAQESFLTWIFSVSLPAFGFFICLCMCCLYFLEFCTGKKKKEEKEPQQEDSDFEAIDESEAKSSEDSGIPLLTSSSDFEAIDESEAESSEDSTFLS